VAVQTPANSDFAAAGAKAQQLAGLEKAEEKIESLHDLTGMRKHRDE
jgi:hypothetical protein